MADISDVEQAIVSLISATLYPNGTSAPCVATNKAGAAVPSSVYRGWPQPAPLDADLAAGKLNISVFSRGSIERNTTRHSNEFREISRQAATVTAALVDNKITIGGAPATGVAQFVTVLVGPRVAASYGVLPGDTSASIAVALSALISAQGIDATVSGSVITVNSSAYLVVNVGVNGTQMSLLRQQQTQVLITMWCPDPFIRDNVAKVIEPVLAKKTFLTMPDTSVARFRYHGTVVSDEGQKVKEYRRDLIYDIEYATTETDTATEVTAVGIGGKAAGLPLGSPGIPTTQSNLPLASA